MPKTRPFHVATQGSASPALISFVLYLSTRLEWVQRQNKPCVRELGHWSFNGLWHQCSLLKYASFVSLTVFCWHGDYWPIVSPRRTVKESSGRWQRLHLWLLFYFFFAIWSLMNYNYFPHAKASNEWEKFISEWVCYANATQNSCYLLCLVSFLAFLSLSTSTKIPNIGKVKDMIKNRKKTNSTAQHNVLSLYFFNLLLLRNWITEHSEEWA